MSNIISTVLIVASLGMYFMYIDPKYADTTMGQTFAEKSIKELQVDEEQYNNALTKTREISEIQTGLLTKFNDVSREDREKLTKILPDHVDTVRLIIDIERVVERHNMKLEDITITSVGTEQETVYVSQEEGGTPVPVTQQTQFGANGSSFDTVSLKFKVSGPYDVFLQFLRDLENSLRIIDVSSLSFSSPQDGNGTGQFEYEFAIKTYFLK